MDVDIWAHKILNFTVSLVTNLLDHNSDLPFLANASRNLHNQILALWHLQLKHYCIAVQTVKLLWQICDL